MAYTDTGNGEISTEDFPAAQEGERRPQRRASRRADVGRLQAYAMTPNLVPELKKDTVAKVGMTTVQEYGLDEESRKRWFDQMRTAMDLALQITAEKSYPWHKAANVVYPLITTAALQFNARAYPAIVDGRNVVKGKVQGRDDDGMKQARADRIARHLSWQLLEKMEEWEEETDRLLIQVPIVGCAFRKVMFDPVLGRNVSLLIPAKDFVVDNATTTSLETCPRSTECMEFYPYQIEEKFRSDLWTRIDYMRDSEDEQKPEDFLEQHRLLDLDGDGYDEPYIVTVHKETEQVVRIAPRFRPEAIEVNRSGEVMRIEPERYYTKYGFIPDPEGGFYELGLGILLNPLNESINTVINQLLDAGHLANMPAGFIGRGLRLKSGETRFRPGEFKTVNTPGGTIRENIVTMDFKGPNPAMFELLGLLIEVSKDVANIKDVLTGDAAPTAKPTTILALIEQGMKTMTTIFKRIHRALKKELKMLARLNAEYLSEEEYFNLLDRPEAIARADYGDKDLDVMPVSDPTMVSDVQRIVRAQSLMEWAATVPFADQVEVSRRYLTAIGTEDPEALIGEMPPNVEAMQREEELAQQRIRLKMDLFKLVHEGAKMRAEIIKLLEEAEAEREGIQLEKARTTMDSIIERATIELETMNALQPDNEGGVSGVEGAKSGNAGGGSVPKGLPRGPVPAVGGGAGRGMGGGQTP